MPSVDFLKPFGLVISKSDVITFIPEYDNNGVLNITITIENTSVTH